MIAGAIYCTDCFGEALGNLRREQVFELEHEREIRELEHKRELREQELEHKRELEHERRIREALEVSYERQNRGCPLQ